MVNAFGDVIDPKSGNIIAGARAIQKGPIRLGVGAILADTLQMMATQVGGMALNLSQRENTVIGVVATNAQFSKEEINYIALMAHDGLARTVRPAHTMLDGDTIFSLSTGNRQADVNLVGSFAAEVFAQAVLKAVTQAESAGGLPARRDITR